MSKSNYKAEAVSSCKVKNYRFNIAKECPICGKSFITNIFEEEDNCSACNAIYSYYAEENTKNEVLDDLITYGWSRSIAIRYD